MRMSKGETGLIIRGGKVIKKSEARDWEEDNEEGGEGGGEGEAANLD